LRQGGKGKIYRDRRNLRAGRPLGGATPINRIRKVGAREEKEWGKGKGMSRDRRNTKKHATAGDLENSEGRRSSLGDGR